MKNFLPEMSERPFYYIHKITGCQKETVLRQLCKIASILELRDIAKTEGLEHLLD